MNSEPEITRRNKIFPGTENSGSSEKLYYVSQLNFFNENFGVHNIVGGDFQSDIDVLTNLLGFTFFIQYLERTLRINKE